MFSFLLEKSIMDGVYVIFCSRFSLLWIKGYLLQVLAFLGIWPQDRLVIPALRAFLPVIFPFLSFIRDLTLEPAVKTVFLALTKLSINDSVYSCLFFFLTGLHFFHLLLGLFLLSLLFWSCSFSILFLFLFFLSFSNILKVWGWKRCLLDSQFLSNN